MEGVLFVLEQFYLHCTCTILLLFWERYTCNAFCRRGTPAPNLRQLTTARRAASQPSSRAISKSEASSNPDRTAAQHQRPAAREARLQPASPPDGFHGRGGCAHAHAQHTAWALALAAAGLLVCARASSRLALWLYAAFLRPARPLRRRYGEWAVVTGATDGIGRALAHRLAAADLGLVLVGRSPDKLAAVAAEIKSTRPGTRVRTFLLDFAAEGLAAKVDALADSLRGLDVGVLVNAAGSCYPYARYFHEVDGALARHLVRLNVEALTRVTRAVLPGMVARGRGAVVNIGSGASAILPSYPLYTVYAATKAYVEQFSRTLYVEYRSKGIDVQCQVPMYVATKMASIRKPSFFSPSPEAYARAAVRYIGYEPVCTPYWTHAVLWFVISILPEPVADKIFLDMALDIRAKGRAKEARKKAQ